MAVTTVMVVEVAAKAAEVGGDDKRRLTSLQCLNPPLLHHMQQL
jgi:hypothetical protein